MTTPSEVSFKGTHTCPHPDCSSVISKRLFACRPHWFQLSRPVQAAIHATVGQHPLRPDRAAAIMAAAEEWRTA